MIGGCPKGHLRPLPNQPRTSKDVVTAVLREDGQLLTLGVVDAEGIRKARPRSVLPLTPTKPSTEKSRAPSWPPWLGKRSRHHARQCSGKSNCMRVAAPKMRR